MIREIPKYDISDTSYFYEKKQYKIYTSFFDSLLHDSIVSFKASSQRPTKTSLLPKLLNKIAVALPIPDEAPKFH